MPGFSTPPKMNSSPNWQNKSTSLADFEAVADDSGDVKNFPSSSGGCVSYGYARRRRDTSSRLALLSLCLVLLLLVVVVCSMLL